MALFQHTLGILTHPDSEWAEIRREKQTFARVFLMHVPLLALIPCIAAYIGVTQVGWSIGGGDTVKLTSSSAMWLSIFSYAAMLAAVYILGEFINWMARAYGVSGSSDELHYEGTALAVYISAPVFLASAVFLYPLLWLNVLVVGAAAIYSIYLIYEGIPILMNLTKEQGFMYASSVVTVGLVILVIVMIGTVITWGMGVGPVYTN